MLALLPASAAANTRIIVKRGSGLSAAERADLRADAGVRYVETLPLPRTEVVTAAPGDVRAALRELNADPDVVYAEPDHVRHATAIPDDPEFPKQWALHNVGDPVDGFLDGTPEDDADMDLPDAWDASTGAGVTVAVVDTGVDDAHPDLTGRVIPGYDWVDDDPDADDESVAPVRSHGTHVAGIIAATMNNIPVPLGVVGVAPDARVLPLRVLDENGSGRVSDIVKAYDFAGARGIRIVNASFSDTVFSQAEHDSIKRNASTLFVVGAGNRGANLDDPNTPDAEFPCAYDLANIECVGASQPDDGPLPASNYGENTVDVFAPGTQIYSTVTYGTGYDYKSGTSMATAHISGVAALLLARTPGLTVNDVKHALLVGSQPKPLLDGYSVSDGRANADDSMIEVDSDSDGISNKEDACPTDPDPCGPVPADADNDGRAIPTDQCPYEPASYAADGCPGVGPDTDGDGWPDVFDVTPRGADADGDGVPALDDLCPAVYGTLSNGCAPEPATPTPSPAPPANRDGDDRIDSLDLCPAEYAISNDGCPLPQIASVSGKVRRRGTTRSVTVKVVTTRLAMLRVTIERKRSGRWRRVKRSTVATVSNRARVAATRIRTGRYRVRVSIYNGAGTGTPVSARFRVL